MHHKWIIYFPVIGINIFCDHCRHIRLCSSLQEKHTPLSLSSWTSVMSVWQKHTVVFSIEQRKHCAQLLFFFFFLRLFAYKQHWAHSSQLLYWAQLIKNLSRTVFTVRQKKKKNTADRQVKKKKKERKKKHNVYNSPQFLSLYSFVLRAEVISGFSCFQRSLVLTWETQSLG